MKYEQEFMQHLFSLQTTGMMFLGKVQNPMSGKVERNLSGAKQVIDSLLMLKEKTKGNLSMSEETLLNSIITQLEVNFVDESDKKEEKPDVDNSNN